MTQIGRREPSETSEIVTSVISGEPAASSPNDLSDTGDADIQSPLQSSSAGPPDDQSGITNQPAASPSEPPNSILCSIYFYFNYCISNFYRI